MTCRSVVEQYLRYSVVDPFKFLCLWGLQEVEDELQSICDTILALLDGKLIAKASSGESKVFYQKMKADYYRDLVAVSFVVYVFILCLEHAKSFGTWAEATLQSSVMVMPRAVQLRRPARPTKRHRMRTIVKHSVQTDALKPWVYQPQAELVIVSRTKFQSKSPAFYSRQRTLPRRIWL